MCFFNDLYFLRNVSSKNVKVTFWSHITILVWRREKMSGYSYAVYIFLSVEAFNFILEMSCWGRFSCKQVEFCHQWHQMWCNCIHIQIKFQSFGGGGYFRRLGIKCINYMFFIFGFYRIIYTFHTMLHSTALLFHCFLCKLYRQTSLTAALMLSHFCLLFYGRDFVLKERFKMRVKK